jgi:hypothetical protein
MCRAGGIWEFSVLLLNLAVTLKLLFKKVLVKNEIIHPNWSYLGWGCSSVVFAEGSGFNPQHHKGKRWSYFNKSRLV